VTLRLRDGKHSNDELECPYFVKLQQACGKQPRVVEAAEFWRCAKTIVDRGAAGNYAVAACDRRKSSRTPLLPLKPLRAAAVAVAVAVAAKILLLLLLCDA